MQGLNEHRITYEPGSGKIELSVDGHVLSAVVPSEVVAVSKFFLPVTVAKLIEPLEKEIDGMWNTVDTEEGIKRAEHKAGQLHEVMAWAFWWATSNYNTLANVRRMHFKELKRMSNECYDLAKKPKQEQPA